ncbi:MAG: hypothetical protein KDD92_02060 [Caldilineaceae bacterium]|nr:hypothetical protein [Caldilineaceae bacterium]
MNPAHKTDGPIVPVTTIGKAVSRLFLPCLLLLLAACQSLSWQPFSAPDGSFELLMPGIPIMQTQKTATAFGELEQTIYMTDMGPQAFFIGYTEVDEAARAGFTDQEILDDFVGRSVTGVGGEVIDFTAAKVEGYPARDVRVAVGEGRETGVITARFILVENRVYQLAAIVADRLVDEEVNARFLDSFTLLDE